MRAVLNSYRRLARVKGYAVPRIRLVVGSRITTQYGEAYGVTFRNRRSATIWLAHSPGWEETLLHEFAHALQDQVQPSGPHDHGPAWSSIYGDLYSAIHDQEPPK